MEKIMTEQAQKRQDPFLLLAILVLLLVTSLTAVTLFFKKASIETDLTQRASRLLTLSGLLKGSVVFDGRDAYIKGNISAEENKDKVLNIVKDVEGVRSVNGEFNIVPLESVKENVIDNAKKTEELISLKERFTLRNDSGQWILVGKVDSETTKENLLSSTQEIIGEKILNRLTVDQNISRPVWVDKYLHVIESFANVHGGAELTLNQGKLIIGGEVDSEAAMRMTLLPFQKTFGDVVSIQNTLRIPKFENGLYLPSLSHPIERIDISGIQFNAENTEIQSTSGLDEIVTTLRNNPELYIEISGHSDLSDDENENIQLGLSRAILVKQYLINHGIKQSHLRANSYGSSKPILNGNTDHNQRIEVTVIREE